MQPALITIGIEKRIDDATNPNLFERLQQRLGQEMIHDHQGISTWSILVSISEQAANEIETLLVAPFKDELKQQCPDTSYALDVLKGAFTPNKIKPSLKELENGRPESFRICYKSDPITLIMKLGEGKLLCAKGDQRDAISQNKEVDTFVLILSDEVTINSYKI